jgi:RimJ/RimL family protein N-acetyltransferase
MPERVRLLDRPGLRGEWVLLREPRESDIDDRLRYPIDPGEEDAYGSSWRREWDGRLYHTREYLAAGAGQPDEPGVYSWVVEHDGHSIGSARLRVDADQHSADYSVGLFVPGLRGQGLGREITRLVLSWGFGELGLHRVELEVLAGNQRAIRCYLACGFRQEGVRREALLYPDGWKDLIVMSVLAAEFTGARHHGKAGR